MSKKNFKLSPGQNLRYTGRFFPGFIKDQPYMVFVAVQNFRQVRVIYNGIEMVVDNYFIDAIC